MKIWHFSDSHTLHGWLEVPENIDLVIFSGDCSNPREVIQSEQECLNFLQWYSELQIPYKIFVAGNHDIAIERRRVSPGDFARKGIIYLENASTIIEGIKIWGSPITPTYGDGWVFNKARDKTHRVWDSIPSDTDIVVTHGPAKGVLDATYTPSGIYERCGCESLRKRIIEIQPKIFMFGHIHSCRDIINAGTFKPAKYNTIYSNGSVIEDGTRALCTNGNIFEL